MNHTTPSPVPSGDREHTTAEQQAAPARTASWLLLAVYVIAIAAAIAVIVGEASDSQLALVKGSIDAWRTLS